MTRFTSKRVFLADDLEERQGTIQLSLPPCINYRNKHFNNLQSNGTAEVIPLKPAVFSGSLFLLG